MLEEGNFQYLYNSSFFNVYQGQSCQPKFYAPDPRLYMGVPLSLCTVAGVGVTPAAPCRRRLGPRGLGLVAFGARRLYSAQARCVRFSVFIRL